VRAAGTDIHAEEVATGTHAVVGTGTPAAGDQYPARTVSAVPNPCPPG
jgi:hypothetical protein